MKKQFLFLVSLIPFSLFGQIMSSDWFDMNLNRKPSYIKEVSMFSIIDYTSTEFKDYLDSSLHSVLITKEYFFDSTGFISRTIEKSKDYYFDSSIDTLYRYDKQQYKDSIVKTIYSPDNLLFKKEILTFNENGFCVRIDYSGLVNGFVEYKRDENNRIILSHEDITQRDTRIVNTSNFQRNNYGDIVTENQTIENHFYTGDTVETEKKIITYSYVYDVLNNWIVRLTYNSDTLILITQRQLK